MTFLESVIDALMSLTMALVPKVFGRNGTLALCGALLAALPWACLSAWCIAATPAWAGSGALMLQRLAGLGIALWAVTVFMAVALRLQDR